MQVSWSLNHAKHFGVGRNWWLHILLLRLLCLCHVFRGIFSFVSISRIAVIVILLMWIWCHAYPIQVLFLFLLFSASWNRVVSLSSVTRALPYGLVFLEALKVIFSIPLLTGCGPLVVPILCAFRPLVSSLPPLCMYGSVLGLDLLLLEWLLSWLCFPISSLFKFPKVAYFVHVSWYLIAHSPTNSLGLGYYSRILFHLAI